MDIISEEKLFVGIRRSENQRVIKPPVRIWIIARRKKWENPSSTEEGLLVPTLGIWCHTDEIINGRARIAKREKEESLLPENAESRFEDEEKEGAKSVQESSSFSKT
jgi:hypothetical protein